MRLAVLFLALLGASLLLCAGATWGLTYAASADRIRRLTEGFSGLAHSAVEDFAQLVAGLLEESGQRVRQVIAAEQAEGLRRVNDTARQLSATTRDLVAFTQNATLHWQTDIAEMAGTFGAFVGSTVMQFEQLVEDLAARLRQETASKASAAFQSMLLDHLSAIQRLARSYEYGVLNLTRTPEVYFDPSDCQMIAFLADIINSVEFNQGGAELYIATLQGAFFGLYATGRAELLYTVPGRPGVDQYFALQHGYADFSEYQAFRQQCLRSGPNSTEVIALGCLPPSGCNDTCLYEPRCRPWYTQHLPPTLPARPRPSEVYIDFFTQRPVLTLSFPVYDPTPRLLAVAAFDLHFTRVEAYLQLLPTSNTTRIAVVLDDAALTFIGSGAAGNCSDAAAHPDYPSWSILRACDAPFRAFGQWLLPRRAALLPAAPTAAELQGTLWDVFAYDVEAFRYFVAVGMNRSEVYGTILESQAAAVAQLAQVQAQEEAELLAGGAWASAFLQATEGRHLAALQQMRTALTARLDGLLEEARHAMNVSRNASMQTLQDMVRAQGARVQQLQAEGFQELQGQLAATVGVLAGVFVALLLVGGYGTVSLTRRLGRIIGLMEDVAYLRVEALVLPPPSRVTEVARIQLAFRQLADQLGQYKSFMPAALFEEEAGAGPGSQPPTPGTTSTGRWGRTTNGSLITGVLPATAPPRTFLTPAAGAERPRTATPRHRPAHRLSTVSAQPGVPRRNIAALVINVLGFKLETVEASCSHIQATLNQYIAVVHEAVSKSRGHVDGIVGDQINVTFNSHIPSADPASLAATAGLETCAILKKHPNCHLKVQIGLSCGQAFVGTVGYTSYKALMAVGPPVKIAAVLAHLSGFREGSLLVDGGAEERLRYTFHLRPACVVHLPVLGGCLPVAGRGLRVFVLQSQKQLAQGEWLYQLQPTQDEAEGNTWDRVFEGVATATSTEYAAGLLREYTATHPEDGLAAALLRRMPHWVPGRGVPICEGVDHGPPPPPSPLPPPQIVCSDTVRRFSTGEQPPSGTQ